MPKMFFDGKWTEQVEGKILTDLSEFFETLIKTFVVLLLGMALGYALAWWHYVGRLAGGN